MNPSDIFSISQSTSSCIITKKHIKDQFKEFKGDKDLTLFELDDWVEETIDSFIEAYNIEQLKPLIVSFKKAVLEDLKFLPDSEEESDEKLLSLQIKERIKYVFSSLSTISNHRDQLESALSYLTVSKKEFLSFKKVISDFYSRNLIVRENIKQKKAIEESIESVTLDLSVYRYEIEAGLAILNSCMEVLNKKQQLILRLESSIRLESKYDEMDHLTNMRQTSASDDYAMG